MTSLLDFVILCLVGGIVGIGVYFFTAWLNKHRKMPTRLHAGNLWQYVAIWSVCFNGLSLLVDVLRHHSTDNHLDMLVFGLAISGSTYLASRLWTRSR